MSDIVERLKTRKSMTLYMKDVNGYSYLEDVAKSDPMCAEAAAEIATLRSQLARAREGLETAREDIQCWASYASEYFQNKHGLADDLAAIDTLLAELPALPRSPPVG